MSKTNYYYNGADKMVDGPGACCNYCCKLALIWPRHLMVKMPTTPIDVEYGHSNDVHMHPSCAVKAVAEFKKAYEQGLRALDAYTRRGN